ncbi:MAG TPA: hypothetical protein VI362_07995 [Ignavibacteriaceae bacterium]|nr:hypothetical protein [Ignavibacteriaceae bacterium]
MDLVKVYIVQSISAASNNLRLNSQQVEVVALLRQMILKSEDLGDDLYKMKRVTEFSKIGIRLNEIYAFLTTGKVDFFKISEKFKEHSQYLIRELNQLLESLSPEEFKTALRKMNGEDENIPVVNIDLSKHNKNIMNQVFEESKMLKENIIMEEEESDSESFHSYEQKIISTIKPLESLLSDLQKNDVDYDKLGKINILLKQNAELSFNKSFEVIGSMHKILSRAMDNIISQKLPPEKNVVESIRACMIVIVAVLKGKEVDITSYLNKAEEFGRKLIN